MNPLQTRVEVHCQSQLVRKSLLSHVLTPPGWNSCRVSTLCGEFSAEREGQSCHQSRGAPARAPQTSAGEAFPVSPPCSMQRDPESSPGTFLVPAGSPEVLGLPGWVTGAGQRPQHPWLCIRSCFPVGSLEFSAHTILKLHTIKKKHRKELYQKKEQKKGASRTYLRCLNHPKVKTNLELKELELLL